MRWCVQCHRGDARHTTRRDLRRAREREWQTFVSRCRNSTEWAMRAPLAAQPRGGGAMKQGKGRRRILAVRPHTHTRPLSPKVRLMPFRSSSERPRSSMPLQCACVFSSKQKKPRPSSYPGGHHRTLDPAQTHAAQARKKTAPAQPPRSVCGVCAHRRRA
jgi:hypothetical protein